MFRQPAALIPDRARLRSGFRRRPPSAGSGPPLKSGSSVIPLAPDYRGTVSFVDPPGYELYMWWGVTDLAYKVQITGRVRAGEAQVCGLVTPPLGLPAALRVRIHDVTAKPQDITIGSAMSDAQGRFCVPVGPALYSGEVLREVLLGEVNGYWSQPVVVKAPLFLPPTRI